MTQNNKTNISDLGKLSKLFQMNDRVDKFCYGMEVLAHSNYKMYSDEFKKIIQDNTKFTFDENNEQWNKFLIRYSATLSETKVYAGTISDILGGISLLSMIMIYVYSLFNSISYIEPMKLVAYNTFVAYLVILFISHIAPYIITYYSLRKEASISRTFFKSLKFIEYGNKLSFIVVSAAMFLI